MEILLILKQVAKLLFYPEAPARLFAQVASNAGLEVLSVRKIAFKPVVNILGSEAGIRPL